MQQRFWKAFGGPNDARIECSPQGEPCALRPAAAFGALGGKRTLAVPTRDGGPWRKSSRSHDAPGLVGTESGRPSDQLTGGRIGLSSLAETIDVVSSEMVRVDL
jgi:hypothetical protein